MTFCDWPGCHTDEVLPIEHVPTGTVKHYCEDHTPAVDAETWIEP